MSSRGFDAETFSEGYTDQYKFTIPKVKLKAFMVQHVDVNNQSMIVEFSMLLLTSTDDGKKHKI